MTIYWLSNFFISLLNLIAFYFTSENFLSIVTSKLAIQKLSFYIYLTPIKSIDGLFGEFFPEALIGFANE